MKRLLNEEQRGPQWRQRGISGHFRPEFTELRHGVKTFITVESATETLWPESGEDSDDPAQTWKVTGAGNLEFEMLQSVSRDACFQRLRQAIIDAFRYNDLLIQEWIRQSHRMAGEDAGWRRPGQPVRWFGASE
jgi:hypothetical protein